MMSILKKTIKTFRMPPQTIMLVVDPKRKKVPVNRKRGNLLPIQRKTMIKNTQRKKTIFSFSF
jgi:hypothetical protein